MKRIVDQIIHNIHIKKDEDSIRGHLLYAMVIFFRSWIAQAAVSIIGTIVIATLVSREVVFDLKFFIASFVYVIITIGICIVNKHDERINEKLKIESDRTNQSYDLINNETILNAVARHDIYRNARYVKHCGWNKNIDALREVFGFQKMSFEICKCIYELCKKRNNKADYYITVYQKFEGSENDGYCKMIAYANHNNTEPASYSTIYSIKKHKHLHTKLFLSGSDTVRILMTHDEVENAFKYHDKAREREEKIQQYIGIATRVCNRGITFLVQLDTDTENAFGKTKEEIKWLVDNIISGYVSQLQLFYEIDRWDEVVDNEVNRLKKEVTNEY